MFWGWGGEDDDFSNRLHSNGYSIVRYSPDISRYTMLPHVKELPTVRHQVVQSSEETTEIQVGQYLPRKIRVSQLGSRGTLNFLHKVRVRNLNAFGFPIVESCSNAEWFSFRMV